jgi:hypothetical protein
MPYPARLVIIAEHGEVPEEYIPFVRFRAALAGITPEAHEKVAILQVEGTGSYFPVFLARCNSIDDLERELREQDTVLTEETKRAIVRYIKGTPR